MVAQWARPKYIKMARERKAWAKPYSMKSSVGPNWANGKIMTDTPLDLTEEVRIKNEKATRTYRVPDITEVRKEIPDPFFICVISTPKHRCRIFYNSQRTVFILQYVRWHDQIVKISIAYPTFTRAMQVWVEDRVRWRSSHTFPQA